MTIGSVSSFAGVMGDLAVDFDIAKPVEDDHGNMLYPIYVMQESGDVWVLHCRFTQNR